MSVDITHTALTYLSHTQCDVCKSYISIHECVIATELTFTPLPIDPPGAPQNPRITDTTKTSVSLAWNPPDEEGGSKVTGYLIEMQKVGSVTWLKCNATPSMICEYTLTQMPPGEEFTFRVLACNAGGPGEPAEVPGTVTITEMQGETIL